MIKKTTSIFNKQIFLVFTLLLLLVNNTFGQTEITDSTQISDSLTLTNEDFNFFMVDFSYTNNKIKIGDQTEISVPAFFSDMSYFHKSGLYTDLMYVTYIDTDTSSYDIDLQAGFQKYFFNEVVDIDINYTYHKYSGIDDYKGLDYNHVLNLSSGFKYELLHIYADGIFYLDNKNYFTDFGLNLLLDFDDVIFKNDYIFLQPTLTVSFGTDYWLYDIYGSEFITKLGYKGYPINRYPSDFIIKTDLQRNGHTTNTYSYQGIDFLVPLTVGVNSISATIAWMYTIPSDKVKAFGLKDQSGFIISLSYIF